MKLRLRPETLVVARLGATEPFPAWALEAPFTCLARTGSEVSVVVPQASLPPEVPAEGPWQALEVQGPLDFSLVGILATLTGILAQGGISVFAFSTYDTDYLLVKTERMAAACRALRAAGHAILEG